MGLTSMHVCMDSSDWFQGTIQEEAAMMDSSSSSPMAISGDILTSRVPLMDNQRRLLRPQHEQAQKCPRCDSTHTKFCYYNNYSLSQPRYFCKACRRYWTKGGTLRNIPVGGGCRKNKKVSSKKPNDQNHPGRSSSSLSSSSSMAIPGLVSNNPTHLQLSFPDDGEFSQLNNSIMSHHGNLGHLNFMDPTKYNNSNNNNSNIMLGNNFMENKYGLSLLANGEMGIMNGGVASDMQYCQGLSQFGMSSSFEVNNVSLMDNGYHQRLMLPYHQSDHQGNGTIDVKPNPKLLTLNWHDQTCPPPDHHAASGGQEDNTIAYLGGLESSWLINHGYGS